MGLELKFVCLFFCQNSQSSISLDLATFDIHLHKCLVKFIHSFVSHSCLNVITFPLYSLSQNICLLLPPSFIIQTQASTYLSLSKSFSLSFYVSMYLSVLLVVLWIFFIRHLAILYFLSGSHWSHSSILSIK